MREKVVEGENSKEKLAHEVGREIRFGACDFIFLSIT